MTVIDDYTRHPIMKSPQKPKQERRSMRELAAHYAKKITQVKPAPRDGRVGAIAQRRVGGKYG